ncbi:hypothetical protein LguiA_017334 [Lonicera macranthoides]
MSWLLTVIILSSIFNINLLEARNGEIVPSAVVIGTVYCDTCFQEKISNTSHFISGAFVAVECSATSSRPSFREKVKTDKNGKFEAHLPFSVTKQAKEIKGCTAKLISSSQTQCAVASTATSSSLQLKSRNPSTHIFSAGILSFKPVKKPNLCNQTPNMNSFSKKLNSDEYLNPLDHDPQLPKPYPSDEKYLPSLPPLPRLPPLPQLPPLPSLPGLPFFHPVPKITPPILPPKPFQPPPFDFPLIPLINPQPPPPPPEVPLQYPIPPFPYQPSPDFSGIPSPDIPGIASTYSSSSNKTSP